MKRARTYIDDLLGRPLPEKEVDPEEARRPDEAYHELASPALEKPEKPENTGELLPTSKELLREELRQALVKGNRWLHWWHMKYGAPKEGSLTFGKVIQEWYEREDAFQSLFPDEGCVLGADSPCLIPAECAACM